MIKYTALVLFGFLILVACKKNQLGGKATIHGKVKHHQKEIHNATVYIKFNAKEFPGRDSTKYDAHVITDHHGDFHFNVYKGDYFLYATGLDYGQDTFYVTGGVPATLRNREEVELDVAVSEAH